MNFADAIPNTLHLAIPDFAEVGKVDLTGLFISFLGRDIPAGIASSIQGIVLGLLVAGRIEYARH